MYALIVADVDAILLVDNAAQPMQGGPGVILRALVTSGHEALRIAFSKFDLVRGGNLRDIAARQDHVRASLDLAISDVGKTVGRSAERALHRALESRVFYFSDIRKPTDELSRFTRAQLAALLESLLTSKPLTSTSKSIPVYDEANLVLAIDRAVAQFHERWRARLGLPSKAALFKEHWTRVKAMTRWISQLNQEGYDSLMPVADLEQAIRDRVYVFLENPVRWDPDSVDADAKATTVAAVCAEVNSRLRSATMKLELPPGRPMTQLTTRPGQNSRCWRRDVVAMACRWTINV